MDLQEIEIYIDQDGQVRIQVRGVKGTACLDLTKELEQALGGQVILREMTSEALDPSTQVDQTRRQSLKK